MKRFLAYGVIFYLSLAIALPLQAARASGALPSVFQSLSRPDSIGHMLKGLANVAVNNPSQDGKSLQRTQFEASVAIFGSHVVVGFNDSNGLHVHGSKVTGCFGGYAYSSDDGATFIDGGCTPFPSGGATLGDPSLTVDPTGVFYYGQVMLDGQGNEYMGVSKSTDFGKTWTQPVNASPKVRTAFQDKDWLSVGINPSDHSKFILYASWTHITQTTSIQLSRSTDGGKTWSAPVNLQYAPGVQGSNTTEDPGTGKVYAFWANYVQGSSLDVEESTSTDGGQTWSNAKAIDSLMLADNANVQCGGSTQSVIEFIPGDTKHVALNTSQPQASVDPLTHHVYAVLDEKTGNNINIVLLSSSDGGSSWHNQLVAPTSDIQFQPTLTVDKHGLHLEFYQVHSNGTYNEAGINGNNAVPPVFGQPFAVSNTPLQPPLTNPTSDPVVRPCAMGDYNKMASNGHNITYVWMDTRHFNKSGQDIWSATTSG